MLFPLLMLYVLSGVPFALAYAMPGVRSLTALYIAAAALAVLAGLSGSFLHFDTIALLAPSGLGMLAGGGLRLVSTRLGGRRAPASLMILALCAAAPAVVFAFLRSRYF